MAEPKSIANIDLTCCWVEQTHSRWGKYGLYVFNILKLLLSFSQSYIQICQLLGFLCRSRTKRS